MPILIPEQDENGITFRKTEGKCGVYQNNITLRNVIFSKPSNRTPQTLLS